jgi:bla regulator protein blaR1
MILGQSNFLQALGWAMLNSLWQMAFLWVIFQMVSGTFRKTSSSQKSYLATGLIIIGFTWFIYTFLSILTANASGNEVVGSGFIIAHANEQLNHWLNTMLPVASIIYLGLLLLPLFYFIRNYRYVQAIRQYELSKVDVQWRIFVKDVAARMGIKKPVHIWLSGMVTSPVTIGYIKPVILLPLAAINQLTTPQLEAVLLHELAHIRRYDYMFNLVIRFIQTILYFNPFVKALMKTVEREREKSCDEMVIQFQYDPHGYATALLVLEKTNYLPKPLAVASSGKKTDLLHRIECMLGVQKKQAISFNKIAGLFAGLLCFIALNALLIISKPAKTPGNTASIITQMSSPFYLFTEDEPARVNPNLPATKEMALPVIVNHALPEPATEADEKEAIADLDDEQAAAAQHLATSAPAYTYVNLIQTIAPRLRQLKNYEEEQVKEAIEASKKVLEEKQWKDVEKRIADVMTSNEKEVLKCQFEKELEKVNWNKMQDKLRMAYDKIDWNSVNEGLSLAMEEIKIDSIHQVYAMAMAELSSLQKELCENNIKGIPDTDISLKSVEQSKKDVQRALNTLNKVRSKKIVHL